MPQAVLGSRAYAEPPVRLRSLNPELYDYLALLHTRLFGAPAGVVNTATRKGLGELDEININGQLTDTVDHRLFTFQIVDEYGVPLDHHTQYLNTTRHGAITGNPHGVTAAEVGNDTAQWNANRIQGRAVLDTVPNLSEVLAWDGLAWAPAVGGGGGGPADTDALPEGVVNLYYTDARARAAASGQLRAHVVLNEPFNGVQTDFSIPYTIALDATARPLAQLIFSQGVMQYTASTTPVGGQWTVVGGIIRLGWAPLSGDYCEFAWVVVA